MKRLLLLPACLSVLLAGCAQQSENSESPIMFRGDPQHTGAYKSAGPQKLDEIKWKFKTDGRVFSSPALHNGTIYFGSHDDFLYAVDEETGSLVRKFKTGNSVHSTPAVSGGIVYCGSWDSYLYALDAKTGELLAQYQTEANRQNYGTYFKEDGEIIPEPFGEANPDNTHEYMVAFVDKILSVGSILSSPVVNNGVVFFGSADGYLYAMK